MGSDSISHERVSDNATQTTGGSTGATMQLSARISELFPMLGGLSHPLASTIFFVLQSVGLTDFSLLVWGASLFVARRYFMTLVYEYYMSTVTIDGRSDMYQYVLKWLAKQPCMANSRNLAAEVEGRLFWGHEEGEEDKAKNLADQSGEKWLNFCNHNASKPPHYVPAIGAHRLRFRGRYFFISRRSEKVFHYGLTEPNLRNYESIMISTLGLSPGPIKEFIQHCKVEYYRSHYQRTAIKRPEGQVIPRGPRGISTWVTVANRPVRPMDTIVLGEVQKHSLLTDMNEYLDPSTRRWYANRGIPWRRGYLFHGPPGTGKTSLSFALAGVFGLDIHIISLMDSSLTDEDLVSLFAALPRRCVVLLEDIDTAGLTRRKEPEQENQNRKRSKPGRGKKEKPPIKNDKLPRNIMKQVDETSGESSEDEKRAPNENLVESLAVALRKSGPVNEKHISLSGLLNAIDGVASHEGHVLIMTTNKPHDLDEALLRPGRVDLQVAFENATQFQARALFLRMYDMGRTLQSPATTCNKSTQPVTSLSLPELADNIYHLVLGRLDKQPAEDNGTSKMSSGGQVGLGENTMFQPEIEEAASEFAQHIPEKKFSPAEIQGFLLKRKKDPQQALQDVETWAKALLEQKAVGTKISHVQ